MKGIWVPPQHSQRKEHISTRGVVQAKEFGEAEVWMNERLMRAAPQYFAEFITAFEDSEQRIGPQRGPVCRSTLPITI